MSYDLIVIGGGPAGYVGAIRAAQLGKKVAVVEVDRAGGTCLNWGCIPTKALLKNAELYTTLTKKAKEFGISFDNLSYDWSQVVGRSRKVSTRLAGGIEFLFKKNKVDYVKGYGAVTGENTVEVTAADGTKQSLTGANILITTGCKSRELPPLPFNGTSVISSKEAMNLPEQPKSLVIIGAGAIGVEFAYFYNSMGTEVTIVEYLPYIVPVEDIDVSKQLEKSFKKSGINIMTSAEVTKVDTSGEGVKATVKTAKGEQVLEADIILSAVGIKTNIENIGLEDVGIAVDRDKILVNDYYQTNIPGYYAIGDVTPGQALAHVASAEGILCVEKIAGMHVEALDYGNIPGCTYASPEIASVGLTEKQAKDQGYDIKVGKFPFSASGKASASGAKDGFVKVIFDAKYGEWLGCHMIGAGVTDMIAEAVLGRKLETTGHEVLKAVHPHPTMSEAVMEAVADAYDEVIHL
mgnify:CR=1 FL=1